jgi:hypothetical protein
MTRICEESVKPALLNAWLNIARAEAVSIVDPDFDTKKKKLFMPWYFIIRLRELINSVKLHRRFYFQKNEFVYYIHRK